MHTTMRPSEKVEQVNVDKKNAQYLYDEGNTAVFMDMETYEQYEISDEQLTEEKKYLVENMQVQMDFVGSELV
ncbi:elongation factor P, partial [Phocaeicola dorei]|nr:elongation factor P [Phocaeicola dorei]